eukprot:6818337-Prymnesium_polylepis.1
MRSDGPTRAARRVNLTGVTAHGSRCGPDRAERAPRRDRPFCKTKTPKITTEDRTKATYCAAPFSGGQLADSLDQSIGRLRLSYTATLHIV